jgi:ATP-binding cassette subfamily F protein 3
MLLLSAQSLVRQFDRAPILDEVSFDLRRGERIGLVGPNGAGKTTLMRILAGADEPDSGGVNWAAGCRRGFLAQHPEFASGRTLLEEARLGLGEIFAWQQESAELATRMATVTEPVELKRLSQRFDQVQQALQHAGGFAVEHRLDEVLQGLGFTKTQYDQPLETLSGGQQNRLVLAQLLLSDPDLMLLDEPTNHLDIEATEWLEQFLVSREQTLLVVSHDRYFLDRVCTRILELHEARLADYPGNFSQYWALREERQAAADKVYEQQQEYIAKTEDYIRKNKYGQNSTRAKDREAKLARVEVVERISRIQGPPMRFAAPTRTGDWVVDASRLTKGFTRPLFSDLTLRIQRGERWGLLGPNGAGKTTLLRTMLGELPPDAGSVRFGTNVVIGYADQQLNGVPTEATAIDAIRTPQLARYTDGQLRDILARFGVVGELALQRVGAMSGGERSKVALARLAALEPNVLILDEPTNHLDLWARYALEQALREFTGTVIFVSHDRYFLDRVATKLLVYEPGRWFEYPGNYSEYVAFRRSIPATEATAAAKVSAKPAEARGPEKEAKRKRQFPFRKLHEIEADIAALEAQVEAWQGELGSEALARDPEKLKATIAAYEAGRERLEQLYAHWEEAMELN